MKFITSLTFANPLGGALDCEWYQLDARRFRGFRR
ncbi:MAG: hypothetical protein GIKADHBN_00311 [Phycisphaerales bacterium]|nr:hypothetical protein [Phycisphaerales bacterium]